MVGTRKAERGNDLEVETPCLIAPASVVGLVANDFHDFWQFGFLAM